MKGVEANDQSWTAISAPLVNSSLTNTQFSPECLHSVSSSFRLSFGEWSEDMGPRRVRVNQSCNNTDHPALRNGSLFCLNRTLLRSSSKKQSASSLGVWLPAPCIWHSFMPRSRVSKHQQRRLTWTTATSWTVAMVSSDSYSHSQV
eukprot:5271387-Amphidinium_carterae.1